MQKTSRSTLFDSLKVIKLFNVTLFSFSKGVQTSETFLNCSTIGLHLCSKVPWYFIAFSEWAAHILSTSQLFLANSMSYFRLYYYIVNFSNNPYALIANDVSLIVLPYLKMYKKFWSNITSASMASITSDVCERFSIADLFGKQKELTIITN